MTDLVWSTEKPTEKGWYWWRREGWSERITYVTVHDGCWFEHLSLPLNQCEWAGPIPRPKEREG